MAETLFMIHGMWGGPWYWAGYRRLFEAAGAPINGPRGQRIQANFMAHRVGAAELGITYTLKNAVASY